MKPSSKPRLNSIHDKKMMQKGQIKMKGSPNKHDHFYRMYRSKEDVMESHQNKKHNPIRPGKHGINAYKRKGERLAKISTGNKALDDAMDFEQFDDNQAGLSPRSIQAQQLHLDVVRAVSYRESLLLQLKALNSKLV